MNKSIFSLSSLLLMLSACSATAPPQFYTLDALDSLSGSADSRRSLKTQTIGIGPVTIPAVLNRKAIITRGAQQSIQVSDNQQWAEPLLDNITRVIARNLTNLNPALIVHTYPWTAFGAVDTRIVIEITRFEAIAGKNVYFDAVWSVRSEADEKTLKQGHYVLTKALSDNDTALMVGQMNTILGEFSRELSRSLN